MTNRLQAAGWRIFYLMAADQGTFTFLDPADLSDGIIRLRLADTRAADPMRAWSPTMCSISAAPKVGFGSARFNSAQAKLIASGYTEATSPTELAPSIAGSGLRRAQYSS